MADWELQIFLGDLLSDMAWMCIYCDLVLDLIFNMQVAWTSRLLPMTDELADR